MLAAIVYGVSLWRVRTLTGTFPKKMEEHLRRDAETLRREIAAIEAELDATNTRIAAASAARRDDRAALFRLLDHEVSHSGRGARILGADGEPIAWWGEDYRAAENRTFQFDVTNLYVTRSRKTPHFTIQAFARIENVPGRPLTLHAEDEWIASMFLHGGFPKQESGTRRILLAKRADSTLWIDARPRAAAEVIESVRVEGESLVAVILALGALALAARHRQAVFRIPMLVLARVALLPVRATNDPLDLFTFDLYGSKLLGPFSKSPFDLFLTAALLAAIIALLRPLLCRLPVVVRALLAGAAAWGFVRIVDNFVANSRISPLPDHVMP
ncbi:MAG TPA: hypothetical protein VFO89_08640, partial [Thermoanaerobaculia bacterium]|nr:hypothetical protein [Thermoanaerobaculia bacterium]